MLSRKLRSVNQNDDVEQKLGDQFDTSEVNSEYKITNCGYGKDSVKILHINRNGPVHEIKEFEVSTRLQLYSRKDYIYGDNTDIVATDSQKNTVYLLAKIHGIRSPEEFGLLLCNHFLSQYTHVKAASINIEESPWERIGHGDGPYKKLHNHAFVMTPTAVRVCSVTKDRNADKMPTVISGIKEMRILKTTQSSFVNFIDDEYRTLPDMKDRLFSTIVRSSWQYSSIDDVDFDKVWIKVKHCILTNFAGEPENGIPSPSVQNTLYLAEKEILETVPQISSIDMEMPNKHYYTVDLSKFPKVVNGENQDVFLPVDKPAGIIYAQLDRKNFKSKL